jgi:predicted nucleotide-binding protein
MDPVVALDLTEDRLRVVITAARRAGHAIVLRGRTIPWDDVRAVSVRRTPQPAEAYRAQAEQERRNGAIIPVGVDWYQAQIGDDVTDDFVTGQVGQSESDAGAGEPVVKPGNEDNVFIIHGRHLEVKDALFAFLNSLGLHPLEWDELVNTTGEGTPYNGRIVQAAFEEAHVVIALFTPDDLARLKPEFLEPDDKDHERQETGQARPNVLFEAGMAMGYNPRHTIFVEWGDLRPFTDTVGRNAVRITTGPAWRQRLKERLKAAGCPVRDAGTAWMTAGTFPMPPSSSR